MHTEGIKRSDKMSKNNTNQPFIIQTMVMRLSEKESMHYVHDKGFTISRMVTTD
jgi:hypothetical protein